MINVMILTYFHVDNELTDATARNIGAKQSKYDRNGCII